MANQNKVKKKEVKSLAGFLKKFSKNESSEDIVRELREERRKSDRY